VFDRFRQADGAASRTRGGLGLGLAIVKQLVELHGGTVQADSPGEGRGATFTVSIPIPALLREPKELGEENLLLEAPRSRVAWEELNPRMLEGVRVLVVEDEADAREMLVTALEHCGAKVLTASSAGEALETLAVETPDVLVSDVGLPGGDGYALMEKVRTLATTKDGRIPALALTAFAGPDDRRRAAAAGFDVNVPKPADPGELIAQVAALAGRERGNKVR
jgi:CheY-like chemotaxis protein